MVPFEALAPAYLATCFLLCVSGVSKLTHPLPAGRALRSAGLPHGKWIVAFIGATELAVGVAAIATPVPAAACVATLYLSFGAFLASLLIRGTATAASCGCAGRKDLPPSWLHAALNGTAAVIALGVLVARPRPTGLFALAATNPATALTVAAGAALIAWLAAQVVLLVPAAFASYQRRVARA
jgi:hypothetical protein